MNKVHVVTKNGDWGMCYPFQSGDKVICWKAGSANKTYIGTVKSWYTTPYGSWGCTVTLANGAEFYPTDPQCLKPLTKLHKALA